MKIMLLMTTYAKNYASTIYQSLFLGVRNISSKSYRGSWGWDDQQFGGSFHTSQMMGGTAVIMFYWRLHKNNRQASDTTTPRLRCEFLNAQYMCFQPFGLTIIL